MTAPSLHLVVPGPLDQRTGGYLYDARMAEGLRRRGWRVTVHSLGGRFPDADETARTSMTAALAAIPAGATALVDGLALGGLPEPVAAERRRLRILALVHHPLSDETGLPPEVRDRLAGSERRALAAAHGVIVTSRFTARGLRRFGVDAGRVRVVEPGTERPPRESARPGSGAPPRLLSVGAVVPRKGHDVLVRALARIAHLPWEWDCAGSLERDPGHAARVLAAVESQGLADRVRFAGECDPVTLAALYAESALFVLASHYEGYGMVLAEALAHGLPIVSTTGGAIPETVPAEAAVLVPPGDDAALAAALAPLLADSDREAGGQSGAERRAVLAAAAHRHAAALPGWDAAAAAFADALTALARPGDGSAAVGRGASG
ncbi:MAG: glycosyltransferase family 4 protein [Acidobacteria bacterium]|nr:glycosyltransferase family 4 protein [Acidobacteriota bacterium]